MKKEFIKIYRGITCVLCITLFGFGALFVRYCILPFKKAPIEKYETLQKSWIFFINLLKFVWLIDIESKDIEKLKNIKNSIIVSTHPSFLDIVILMSIIPHSTCFVADKLAKNPFFKGMVKLLFILEGQSTDIWLDEACKKLEDGINIIIFPMGTRHKRDEHLKIRRGAALIALKSHKNIETIRLNVDTYFLQIHRPVYEAGDKLAVYDIEYAGQINTEEFLNKFPDEVSFKTEVSKEIAKILYEL